jgi:hypothetical protein
MKSFITDHAGTALPNGTVLLLISKGGRGGRDDYFGLMLPTLPTCFDLPHSPQLFRNLEAESAISAYGFNPRAYLMLDLPF